MNNKNERLRANFNNTKMIACARTRDVKKLTKKLTNKIAKLSKAKSTVATLRAQLAELSQQADQLEGKGTHSRPSLVRASCSE